MTTLLNELVDARVDHLNGEGLGQLGQRSRRGAAYAGDGAVGAGDLDAEGLVLPTVVSAGAIRGFVYPPVSLGRSAFPRNSRPQVSSARPLATILISTSPADSEIPRSEATRDASLESPSRGSAEDDQAISPMTNKSLGVASSERAAAA